MKESQDPTLRYRPYDEVDNMIETQVLQNVSQKIDVSMSLLHKFPFYQALWGTFMNSCMWAAAYLSKHEKDFKQVIQNLEVWKIETIFGTVQAQISNLKHRDHARCGLEEEVD